MLYSGQNHLLASLPAADLRRWLPQLEAIELPARMVPLRANMICDTYPRAISVQR